MHARKKKTKKKHAQTLSVCPGTHAGVLSEPHILSSLAPESFLNPVR